MTEMRIVLSTVPDKEAANRMARLAVESNLAACVQILPGARSIYRWQGKVEESEELLLLFKTAASKVDALRELVLSTHSYQTPEFIVVPVESASSGYLEWLFDAISGSMPPRSS